MKHRGYRYDPAGTWRRAVRTSRTAAFPLIFSFLEEDLRSQSYYLLSCQIWKMWWIPLLHQQQLTFKKWFSIHFRSSCLVWIV